MHANKILSFFKILLLLILFIISLVLLGNSLFQRNSVQRFLVKNLSDISGWHIQIGNAELNFWHGLGIYIHDLSAGSPDNKQTINSSGARLILDANELLKGRIVPTNIYLLQPDILLSFGDTPDETGMKGQEELRDLTIGWIPCIQSISVEKGNLLIKNEDYRFEEIHLEVRQQTPSPLTLIIDSRGNIVIEDRTIPFKAGGRLFQQGHTLPSFDIMVETDKAPLDFFRLNNAIDIGKSFVKSKLNIQGLVNGETSVAGSLLLDPLYLALDYHGQTKDVSLENVNIDFQALIRGRSLDIPRCRLNSDDLSLYLSMKLDRVKGASPQIDFAAKSMLMDIETFKNAFPSPFVPWLEKELFPIFENGRVQVQEFNIKGDLDQLYALGKPQNHSVMEMIFDCHDFTITGNGIRIPFKDVSAQVAIEKGDLKISNLRAVFNNSIMEDCALEIKGIYDDLSYIETIINGEFDLQDLISQKNMGFIPEDVRLPLDYLESISGKIKCSAIIGYKDEWTFPRITLGDFKFTDCLLEQESVRFPLSIHVAEFHMDGDDLNDFSGSGSWGGTSIDTSGSFGINGKEFRIYRADLEAMVNMNQVLSFLNAPSDLPIKFKDPLPSRISFVKRQDRSSFFGEVDLEGIIMENEDFSVDPLGEDNRIIFELDYGDDKSVELKDTMIRLGDSHMQITGDWDPKTSHETRLELEDIFLKLEDLGILYKRTGAYARGGVTGNLGILLSGTDSRDLSVTGELSGDDLHLNFGITPHPVKNLDFRAGFSDRLFRVYSSNLTIGGSDISITGELEGWDGLRGDLKITSEFIDFYDIFPRKASLSSEDESKDSRFLKHININGEIDIQEGLWRDLKWKRFKAGITLRGKDLFVNNSRTQLEHGTVEITGYIRNGKDANRSLNGKILLTDQPVDELLGDIRSQFQDMKGNLDLVADLSVTGKGKEEFIPNLSGSFNVMIKNGLIKKSNMASSILDSLSLQNIYKKRPANVREKGFYFETLSADAEINRGVLVSNNFIMRSPAFNSVAYGNVDLREKTVDFILGVQPHGTIDSIVSGIPILGYIITGENRSIITYPFEVTGPMSDPRVDFMPMENLGKSVAGILERLFLTPKRLFDEIQDSDVSNGEKETTDPENAY